MAFNVILTPSSCLVQLPRNIPLNRSIFSVINVDEAAVVVDGNSKVDTVPARRGSHTPPFLHSQPSAIPPPWPTSSTTAAQRSLHSMEGGAALSTCSTRSHRCERRHRGCVASTSGANGRGEAGQTETTRPRSFRRTCNHRAQDTTGSRSSTRGGQLL